MTRTPHEMPPPPTPRWVKRAGFVAALLMLLMALHLAALHYGAATGAHSHSSGG